MKSLIYIPCGIILAPCNEFEQDLKGLLVMLSTQKNPQKIEEMCENIIIEMFLSVFSQH